MFNKKKTAAKKSSSKNQFNMLSFGTCFLDEGQGNEAAKGRIILRKNKLGVQEFIDENGTTFTRREMAHLPVEALLDERAISFYLFDQEDGSLRGNARINIHGLSDAEAEADMEAPKAKAEVKPVYTVPDTEAEADEDLDF